MRIGYCGVCVASTLTDIAFSPNGGNAQEWSFAELRTLSDHSVTFGPTLPLMHLAANGSCEPRLPDAAFGTDVRFSQQSETVESQHR
jgi:hypothetical protein